MCRFQRKKQNVFCIINSNISIYIYIYIYIYITIYIIIYFTIVILNKDIINKVLISF